MEHTVSGVGVLDKSIAILLRLETGSASLSELVSDLGLAKPTAHRLAAALEHHGLVRRDGGGRYVLGVRLVALGRAAAEALPLGSAAAPALRQLREQTGESVQLYVADDDRRVCIAALESPHGLRTIVAMGASLPINQGSAGKVLRSEPSTVRRGWAESVGEREAGVASVSAPVRDGRGEVLAAVSVSGPIERTTRNPGRKYARAVLEAAGAIEVALQVGNATAP